MSSGSTTRALQRVIESVAASVGAAASARSLATHSAGVLAAGDLVEVRAGADGARLLLLAGKPLGEPVVQHGPFVMSTRAEIEQAIRDYQSGELTRPARSPD